MDLSPLVSMLLTNPMQAKFLAGQLGLPESFVDTAISIADNETSSKGNNAATANMVALKLMNAFKEERTKQLEKQPNQLLVMCKTCSTVNRVTIQ